MRSYEDSAFCSRIALLQQYVISWSIWMAPGQTGQDLDMYTPLVSSVRCHCAAVEGSTVSPFIHVNQVQDWPDFVMSNAKQHCIDNFCQDTLSDRNLSPLSNAGKDERTYQAYVKGLWCLPLSFKDLCFSFFYLALTLEWYQEKGILFGRGWFHLIF